MAEVVVTVTARDRASAVLKGTETTMQGMGTAAADVSAKFLLVTTAIQQAYNMVNQFISGAVNLSTSIARSAAWMNDYGVTAGQVRMPSRSWAILPWELCSRRRN